MRRIPRTTLITSGCLCVIIGLGAAYFRPIDLTYWWLAALPLALLLSRKNYLSLFAVVIIGLVIGLWRGVEFSEKHQLIEALDGQKVTIIAKAHQEAIYSYGQQLEFIAGSIQLEPSAKLLPGKVLVRGFGVPAVHRGDIVKVSGRLSSTNGSYQARFSYAQLEIISADSRPINRLTRNLSAGAYSALPEPNASFGLGILIGQRNNLPPELYQQMIMVGLVH